MILEKKKRQRGKTRQILTHSGDVLEDAPVTGNVGFSILRVTGGRFGTAGTKNLRE